MFPFIFFFAPSGNVPLISNIAALSLYNPESFNNLKLRLGSNFVAKQNASTIAGLIALMFFSYHEGHHSSKSSTSDIQHG